MWRFCVGLLVHYGIKKTGDRNSVRVAEERSKLILEKARQEAVSIEKEIRVKSTEEQLVFRNNWKTKLERNVRS